MNPSLPRQTPAAGEPPAGTGLRRANLFFALGVGLLVALSFGALLGWREFGQAEALRAHSFRVLDQLSEVREALLEVETGARGFALSGTPDYLEPFEAGRRALGPALAQLRTLTAAQPGQPASLAELETLAGERLASAEQVVRVRREEGLDAVQKLRALGVGKQRMDAARRVLGRMEAEERRQLAVREAASQRAERQVLVVSTVARVTAVGLFIAAFLLFRREWRRRAVADAALQQANAELEQRVGQRTAALLAANQTLTATQARLKLIIETEPECVKLVSPRGEVVEMNAAGLAMLEATSFAELAAQPLLHYIAPEHQRAFVALHGQVMAGQAGTLAFEVIGLRGTRRCVETHAVPLRDASGEVSALLGVTRDITQQRQAEAIVACQTQVLELIAKGTPLAETLATMLTSMEAFAPGMLGSVLLLDEDGIHVRHGAAPSLPEAFSRAVDGQPIGPCAGSCGTTAFRREPVIVADIATDPLWAGYRELALAHGLRACWSTPILDPQQRVLGTFAIYYRQAGQPPETHRQCVELATQLAATAIARHRDEQALRASEAKLRKVIDGLGPNMFVGLMTPAGVLLEANTTALAAAGLKPEDVLGQPFDQTYWWSYSAAVQRELRTAIALAAGGTPSRYDVQVRAAEGVLLWLDFSLHPLCDATGAVVFLVPSAMVISERKGAEAALREAEARLRLAVTASNIGLWDWNLVSNEVYFSREWKSQLGYAEDELPNRFGEWESRVHPDDLAPTVAQLQAFMADPAAKYAVEFRLRHKDGTYRWIFTQAKIFREAAGQPVRMMGCHLDITERKHAEDELVRLSGRLLRAQDEERRRLARELHDSTAQVFAALAMNLAVLGRSAARLDAAGQALLAECESQVQRGTTELRTFAYLLHPPALEALGLVRAIHDYAVGFAKRSGVVLTLDVPEPATRLPADLELTLFRVVQECLGNIHRHAGSATASIQLATTATGVTLEVRDAGCGLTLAQFSGLRSGSLQQGVGFAGMRERLRLLGGRLELEPGAPGLCVRAVLPLKRVEPAQLG